MTQGQRSDLEMAIERADRKGVHVLYSGTLKKSGTRYFAVAGHTAQRNHDHVVHFVRVEGTRLVCDCKAAEYSARICTHRAVAHLELAKEHAAIKAAQVIEARLQAESAQSQLEAALATSERMSALREQLARGDERMQASLAKMQRQPAQPKAQPRSRECLDCGRPTTSGSRCARCASPVARPAAAFSLFK